MRRGVENPPATPLPSETPGETFIERDKIFGGLATAQDKVKVIVTLAQPTGTARLDPVRHPWRRSAPRLPAGGSPFCQHCRR